MTRTWRIRRDYENLSGSWLLRYIRIFERELADPDTLPERRKEVVRRLRIAEEVFQDRLDDYVQIRTIQVCATAFEFMTEWEWERMQRERAQVSSYRRP